MSQGKEILRKKGDKYISGFLNNSPIFPSDNLYSYSYLQVYNSKTIPIPIHTEVGFANLFIFLSAGKLHNY